MGKLTIILASLLLLVSFTVSSTASAQQSEDKIPGQYIVVLRDDIDSNQVTDDLEKTRNFHSNLRYSSALNGFAASLSADRLDKIKKDSRVKYVVEDRVVSIAASQTTSTGYKRIEASASSTTAFGIGVAVIDTGIDLTHPDLTGNVTNGVNCINKRKNANDDNGHGSHVAGIIAAKNNAIGIVGVAPGAKLLAVKVLNSAGSGTWSSVICGIDWVTANAQKYNIKVANMSLGGGGSSDQNCGNTNNDPLHKAICRSRDAGITYAVAAGNSTLDSSTFVPAAYDDAVITVSALNDSDGLKGGFGLSTGYGADDTFASFSNFGSVIDIGAPGVNIYSTYKSGGYATISGTSMATPFVTASAALYIKNHPGATWTDIRDALRNIGEPLGSGHSDPSGKHPEPVLKINSL